MPQRRNAERRRRVLQVWRGQSGEDDLRISSHVVFDTPPLELSFCTSIELF
jgi:hypothetical protein